MPISKIASAIRAALPGNATPRETAQYLLDAGLDLKQLETEQRRIKKEAKARQRQEHYAKLLERKAARKVEVEKALAEKKMKEAKIDQAFADKVIAAVEKRAQPLPYQLEIPTAKGVAEWAIHLQDQREEATIESVTDVWMDHHRKRGVTIRSHGEPDQTYYQ